MDSIFGYDWSDIQRVQQQNGSLGRSVDLTAPAVCAPTAEDRALLACHGSLDALEAAGLYGVADRLRHHP